MLALLFILFFIHPSFSDDIEFINMSNNMLPAYRGIYKASFQLLINSTVGDCVRFSTDGVLPVMTSGLPMTASPHTMLIDKTTPLLVATCDATDQRNVTARSYFFLSFTQQQPNAIAGFPTQWSGGGGRAADYEFLPDPQLTQEYEQGLAELPIVSLILEPEQFTGPNGFYESSSAGGIQIERSASLEIIKPGGVPTKESFSDRCGMRPQGGSSAEGWKSPKLSMRMLFRSDYGSGKLSPPAWLFKEKYRSMRVSGGSDADGDPFDRVRQPADKFNTLLLDAGLNHQWNHPSHGQHVNAVYYRDQFVADMHLKMGRLSVHGVFVHVFVSGIYWGVHGLHERPDDDFLEQYFGRDRESYDVIRHSPSRDPLAGSSATWIATMNAASAAASADAFNVASAMFDLPSFVDYMLVNFWAGNTDWDHHNWYAGRMNDSTQAAILVEAGTESIDDALLLTSDFERILESGEHSTPMRWFPNIWDAEHSLTSATTNRLATNNNNAPTDLHQTLLSKGRAHSVKDNDYFVLWRDAVHRHLIDERGVLFANGDCDTAQVVNHPCSTFGAVANRLRNPLALDSGRWGDSQHAGQVDGLDIHDAAMASIKNGFFNNRRTRFLADLAALDLAPRVDAVEMQEAADGTAMNIITRPAGSTVSCTLNGKDPRKAPAAEVQSVAAGASLTLDPALTAIVVCRAQVDGEWSPPTRFSHLARHPTANWARKVIVSEVMFNPLLESLEFLELHNGNAHPVDLSLAQCLDGLRCQFPLGSVVPANGFYLIARRRKEFLAGYGLPAHAVFADRTKLSNDGELVHIRSRDGQLDISFAYNDGVGWPELADGPGHSLVPAKATWDALMAGNTAAVDLSQPIAWVASMARGGSAGQIDAASTLVPPTPVVVTPAPTTPPPTAQPTPLPPGATFAPTPQPTTPPPTSAPTPLPPGATFAPTPEPFVPPPTFVAPNTVYNDQIDDPSNGDSSGDMGMIIGIVCGAVVCIALVALVIVLFVSSQRKKQRQAAFFGNGGNYQQNGASAGHNLAYMQHHDQQSYQRPAAGGGAAAAPMPPPPHPASRGPPYESSRSMSSLNSDGQFNSGMTSSSFSPTMNSEFGRPPPVRNVGPPPPVRNGPPPPALNRGPPPPSFGSTPLPPPSVRSPSNRSRRASRSLAGAPAPGQGQRSSRRASRSMSHLPPPPPSQGFNGTSGLPPPPPLARSQSRFAHTDPGPPASDSASSSTVVPGGGGQGFVCHICSNAYVSNADLRTHQNLRHNGGF